MGGVFLCFNVYIRCDARLKPCHPTLANLSGREFILAHKTKLYFSKILCSFCVWRAWECLRRVRFISWPEENQFNGCHGPSINLSALCRKCQSEVQSDYPLWFNCCSGDPFTLAVRAWEQRDWILGKIIDISKKQMCTLCFLSLFSFTLHQVSESSTYFPSFLFQRAPFKPRLADETKDCCQLMHPWIYSVALSPLRLGRGVHNKA